MIKTWKEQMTPNTTMGEQLVLMQAEIDALKDYVKVLEPDANDWRNYKARKDAAISAGFGKSPLRDEMKEGAK